MPDKTGTVDRLSKARTQATKGLPSERELAVIAALIDPDNTPQKVADKFKTPVRGIMKIWDKYGDDRPGMAPATTTAAEITELKRFTNAEMIERLEDFISQTLGSIDVDVIEKANLRDRMVSMGVAIDKRQLLLGEATVIHGVDRRKKIEELMPMLIEEAKRRGIDPRGMRVDLKPTEYREETPQEPETWI